MPRCDSSETCTRAVWPKPSPAVLLPSSPAGISEVSRFSCMKFLGVSGVFDYAGLSEDSRCRHRSYCLPPLRERWRPDCIFSELNTHPAYSLSTLPCVPRGSSARLEAEWFATPFS